MTLVIGDYTTPSEAIAVAHQLARQARATAGSLTAMSARVDELAAAMEVAFRARRDESSWK